MPPYRYVCSYFSCSYCVCVSVNNQCSFSSSVSPEMIYEHMWYTHTQTHSHTFISKERKCTHRQQTQAHSLHQDSVIRTLCNHLSSKSCIWLAVCDNDWWLLTEIRNASRHTCVFVLFTLMANSGALVGVGISRAGNAVRRSCFWAVGARFAVETLGCVGHPWKKASISV